MFGPGMFKEAEALGCAFVLLALAMIPLGLWKLCEIVYWIWTNVHFGGGGK